MVTSQRFQALFFPGAVPVYVEPEYDERWQVAHGVDPARLEQALREHPEAVAAMVFTPTYYGRVPMSARSPRWRTRIMSL
jgi:arginine/lysine/ornithine decarboxylase